MPIYERTGMISHRHPFYGYGQNSEEDVVIIQEPEATIEEMESTVPAVSVEEQVPVVSQPVILEETKPTPTFAVGGALLTAAEVAALSIIWTKHKQPKTWPWYALAGFIGLRAVGSVVGLIEAASKNGNNNTTNGNV